ncbi:MAG TPA: HEAT repeat domain-containing protein [Verrucomicrobiae bacterium]|nr:HEAT repeat domain-containing protein [Verrucomicrobiae bacterium]
MESRKRNRLLLALAGTALLLLILYLGTAGEREPTYEGRPLSEWISIYGENVLNRGSGFHDKEQDAAANAIRAIGTNGLPFLIKWIAYDPGTLRLHVWTREDTFANWLRGRSIVHQWLFGGSARAYSSQSAFEVLGDQAIPAIPKLHRIACTAGRSETQMAAVTCLFNIGPAATAALTNVLTTTGIVGEPYIRTRLRQLGANSAPFVPILVEQLKHGSLDSAFDSADMLGALKLNPEEVIPALIERLADPHPEIRAAAASSLARFGAQAINALPALNQLETDPERRVSAAASDAITAITGVALEGPLPDKVGVRSR